METTFAAAKAARVCCSHPGCGCLQHPWQSGPKAKSSQHWQLLGFFSKKLFKTEVNYSTFDRELLAVVLGINYFHLGPECSPFQLWIDYKPLIFALNRI
jgi:hypothetical protein